MQASYGVHLAAAPAPPGVSATPGDRLGRGPGLSGPKRATARCPTPRAPGRPAQQLEPRPRGIFFSLS